MKAVHRHSHRLPTQLDTLHRTSLQFKIVSYYAIRFHADQLTTETCNWLFILGIKDRVQVIHCSAVKLLTESTTVLLYVLLWQKNTNTPV